MQFGPSLCKRNLQGLVEGTGWNEFIELNRMAFGPNLPRNSESRALGVALRMLRANAPHLRWVVSFADGAQCGDGTIYRAAGFLLTQIKPNRSLLRFPGGEIIAGPTLACQGPKGGNRQKARALQAINRLSVTECAATVQAGSASLKPYLDAGAEFIPGFQLRYVYCLDPTARERLTCPVLPYSAIGAAGAYMYLGKPRVGSADSGTPGTTRKGLCDGTPTLHPEGAVHA